MWPPAYVPLDGDPTLLGLQWAPLQLFGGVGCCEGKTMSGDIYSGSSLGASHSSDATDVAVMRLNSSYFYFI